MTAANLGLLPVLVWNREEWEPRAEAHAARVDAFVGPHLARRGARVKHPVHDFAYRVLRTSPTRLFRWRRNLTPRES